MNCNNKLFQTHTTQTRTCFSTITQRFPARNNNKFHLYIFCLALPTEFYYISGNHVLAKKVWQKHGGFPFLRSLSEDRNTREFCICICFIRDIALRCYSNIDAKSFCLILKKYKTLIFHVDI